MYGGGQIKPRGYENEEEGKGDLGLSEHCGLLGHVCWRRLRMALRLRMCARGVRSASSGLCASGCLRAQTGMRPSGSILWSALSCEDSKTLALVVLVRSLQDVRRTGRMS